MATPTRRPALPVTGARGETLYRCPHCDAEGHNTKLAVREAGEMVLVCSKHQGRAEVSVPLTLLTQCHEILAQLAEQARQMAEYEGARQAQAAEVQAHDREILRQNGVGQEVLGGLLSGVSRLADALTGGITGIAAAL